MQFGWLPGLMSICTTRTTAPGANTRSAPSTIRTTDTELASGANTGPQLHDLHRLAGRRQNRSRPRQENEPVSGIAYLDRVDVKTDRVVAEGGALVGPYQAVANLVLYRIKVPERPCHRGAGISGRVPRLDCVARGSRRG